MTKQLNYSIKTYEDLYNLWSSDPFFRSKHPYLPDLRVFAKQLQTTLTKGNLSQEVYMFLAGAYLDEKDPLLIEHMRPYIVKMYMNNGVICVDKDTQYIRIFRSIAEKYNYIIRICDTEGLKYFYDVYGQRRIKEMFASKILEISKIDGSVIDCDCDTNPLSRLLYDLTGIPEYKPSAYAVLQCFKKNYVIDKYVIEKIVYIHDNKCIWTVHDNSDYNLLRENCQTLYKDRNIKSIDYLLCRQNGKWVQHYAMHHLADIIGYAKKYNWNVNDQVTNGSYLVHYASQQGSMECMKELLDMGAKLLDEQGSWLLGENSRGIYSFSKDVNVLNIFLCDYYKDNVSMLEKVQYKEKQIMGRKIVSVPKNIDPDNITIEIECDDYDEIDWSSIPDATVRQDMQAEYFKLYLQKKGIEQ